MKTEVFDALVVGRRSFSAVSVAGASYIKYAKDPTGPTAEPTFRLQVERTTDGRQSHGAPNLLQVKRPYGEDAESLDVPDIIAPGPTMSVKMW
ncbi:hypothetical protein PR003_g13909 [Phytophthora rubi]|uniref:Uncharacterized protein n=1 Tax=Phytophthora rubi TaxID=129364 RepID=A0A6A4FDY7_9STRA|nr:hypothetical protein PR001_g14723 [Phytophthora rubi]KAE9016685.1 hypothetical protein PR002_g13599 [Phytophthora rubi]KAE9333668.1 hypothetical protein PR003_g13909 [Phytophthora rubi]